jgi:flagellar hook-associated protein 3 FlgL
MSGILNNLYDNVSYALGLHSQDMLRLQEEVTSGSRINRVSDEASTAHHILTLDTRVSGMQNYIDNLDGILNVFELTTTTIQSMNNELITTKELLTQVAGGIYGEENRQRIAEGIDDHLEQIVQLANTKHLNEFLFGGEKTGTLPYTVTRDNEGSITEVTYQGSADERSLQTAPGVESDVYLVGAEVFQSNHRSAPEWIVENTGAALATGAGSGTSSVTGDNWLTVVNNGTDYVLSLDGGTAVDLTGMTAAERQNVALTDTDGRVLYVDASGTLSEGTDLIRVQGTYSLFDALISARDIVKNTHNLLEHQQLTAIQHAVDSIGEVSEQILQTDVSVGLTTGFLYDLQQNIDNQKANAEQEKDALAQVDIAQVAIDLSRRQVLYEMSLSVAGRLMQVSLLDFIR